MMAALAVFLPAALSGMALVHLLWPERSWAHLALKIFLGIGIGLGIQSLLHFLYLLFLANRHGFLYIDLLILLGLAVLAARQELSTRHPRQAPAVRRSLTSGQRVLMVVGGLVTLVSLLATANYLLRRRQGDWDAWMMYNRAARFVYIDQAHWMESFSPQMDPIFHPDYPLLLAMNISAGWDMLGRESAAVPMLQSALFAVACAGLVTAGLAVVKSVGQAALGITLLWGIPVFVNEGARQMADVPLAFFILATGMLFYLYSIHGNGGLLTLAGLTAGLAAWTKNEGSVFVVGAGIAVLLAFARRRTWQTILQFGAGLAAPLVIVLYFKVLLAPPGDILSSGIHGTSGQITDLSRHALILRYLWQEITGFGSWGLPGVSIGILPILIIFYLVFRQKQAPERRAAYTACALMLGIQLLGYYAAYLISPYDLAWHLAYSSTRIVVQVFPILLFLTLSASMDAEKILDPRPQSAME